MQEMKTDTDLGNHFGSRWLKEYIPALQERHKWSNPNGNAQVGDLVLLVDPCFPRGSWLLGRIIKVMPVKDGLVRTAVVKTKSSNLIRRIQKLCLLEETRTIQKDSPDDSG